MKRQALYRGAPATAIVILFSKILQQSMPQLFLAAQVFHTADEPGLDPLRRRPLHPLGRRPCVVLDALPEPFA